MGLRLFAKLWRRRQRSARRGGSAILSAAVVVFLGTGLMAVSTPAAAMIMNVGGGFYCNVTVYSVDGEIQGWFYSDCFYDPPFGGGGNPGPNPDGYHPDHGGGGGPGGNPGNCSNLVATGDSSHTSLYMPPDPGDGGGSGNSGSGCDDGGAPTTTEISDELKCQLRNYGDLGMQPTQSVKKSDQYNYQNYTTKKYQSSPNKLNLGPEWGMISGTTNYDGPQSSDTETILYQGAFEAYNGPQVEGSLNGPSIYISSMTAEEHALFTYAHESAHQNGVDVAPWQSGPNEQHYKANYYGISAVESMKAAKAGGRYKCD